MTYQEREEENKRALYYMDKLLPLLPENLDFILLRIIKNSNWQEQDIQQATKSNRQRYNYAKELNSGIHLVLTPEGRKASQLGGHYQYEKFIEERDKSQSFHTSSTTIHAEQFNQSTSSGKSDVEFKPLYIKNKPDKINIILTIIGLILTALGVWFAYQQLR